MNITDSLSAWIPQVQGKYINMDGAYGAQCWDLGAHWSAFLGLPIINTGYDGRWIGWAGNMVDAYPQTTEIAAAYELIGPNQKGEPGDIVVWDDSYWYYPATHVAVLIKDNGPQLMCMSQNSTPSRPDNPYPGASSGPTTIQSLPRQGLIGFLRPRTGLSAMGTTTPIEEDDLMATPEQRQELIKELLDTTVDESRAGKQITLRQMLSEYRGHVVQTQEKITSVPENVLNARVPRGGQMGGETSLGAVISWSDQHVIDGIAATAAVAANDGATVEDIEAAVKQAIAESVVNVSVTVAGKP